MPGRNVCELPERVAGESRDVSNGILWADARAQEANFVRGEPSADAAAVELFRRAIADNDEEAWEAVVALYRGLLSAQSVRQVVRTLVDEDSSFCVDRAFQRFWRATRARGLNDFHDLASILKYLQMCLCSVLLDEARARRRRACISLDDLPTDAEGSTDPSADVVAKLTHRELWQAVERELRTDDERLVAHLSFRAELSPREIFSRYPERFADVSAIYRLKRNVIERLRRSPAIHELLS